MAILEKSSGGTYEAVTIKPGMYPATYVGEPEAFDSPFADENGDFPPKLRHTWLVDGPDGEVELSSFTSTKVGHEKATLTRYFVAALGQDVVDEINGNPDDEFDTDDLIGKPVIVTVKNKTNKQGVKISRVTEVEAAE